MFYYFINRKLEQFLEQTDARHRVILTVATDLMSFFTPVTIFYNVKERTKLLEVIHTPSIWSPKTTVEVDNKKTKQKKSGVLTHSGL